MILFISLRVLFEITVIFFLSLIFLPLIGLAKLICKYFESDLLGNIQYMDTILVGINPTNALMNIVCRKTFTSSMNVEKLRKDFKKRLLESEDNIFKFHKQRLTLTWKFFMGYPFWKKTDFKLENHIREYDYRRGGMELPNPCAEKHLEKIFPLLLIAPWREDQSPWELLVINNYMEDGGKDHGKTVVILRTDHVLLDGRNWVKVFGKIFDWHFTLPTPKMSQINGKSFYQRCLLWTKMPYDYIKMVERMRKRNPFGTGRGGRQDLFVNVSGKIPTEVIKSIRKHYGVSHAAVLHSIFNGALEEFLLRGNISVPERLAGLYGIPARGDAKDVTGNDFLVTSPGWEIFSKTSEARLTATQKGLKEIYESYAPVMYNLVGFLLSNIPISIIRLLDKGAFGGVSIINSNIPIWSIEPNDKDARLHDMCFGITPFPVVGMTSCIAGLNDYHRFVTTFDRNIIPGLNQNHMSNFGRLLEAEVEKLMKNVKHIRS